MTVGPGNDVIVKDGVTGLNFPVGDGDALVECLDTSARGPRPPLALGAQARAAVVETYSSTAVARRLTDLYTSSGGTLRDQPRPPSLLMVTTVADTMHFLEPYAHHFRALGWRVEGAADGITISPRAAAFDTVYDVPFSRSIKDPPPAPRRARAISDVLDGRL